MKEKMMRIFELCLEIQQNNGQFENRDKTTHKPCVFLEYSGHVNLLRVYFFKDGWDDTNTYPDDLFNIFLNCMEDEEIDDCLDKLEELKDKLEKL